jgi:hypothetical protein
MPAIRTPTSPVNIASAITSAMPLAVQAICAILGITPDTVLSYRATESGGVVVIVGQGQKFTFTAEQVNAEPQTVRAQLQAQGLSVLRPLDPTRRAGTPDAARQYEPNSLIQK